MKPAATFVAIVALSLVTPAVMAFALRWAGGAVVMPAMVAAALAVAVFAGRSGGGLAWVSVLAAGLALFLPLLPGLTLLVVATLLQQLAGVYAAENHPGAGLAGSCAAAVAVPSLLVVLVAGLI